MRSKQATCRSVKVDFLLSFFFPTFLANKISSSLWPTSATLKSRKHVHVVAFSHQFHKTFAKHNSKKGTVSRSMQSNGGPYIKIQGAQGTTSALLFGCINVVRRF